MKLKNFAIVKKKTKEFIMASYKRTSKVGTSSALTSNSDEKEANTEVSSMPFTLVILFPEIISCLLQFDFN